MVTASAHTPLACVTVYRHAAPRSTLYRRQPYSRSLRGGYTFAQTQEL